MTDQNVTEELGAAGVPQDAMRRLAELQPGRAGSIFTSDLSVNEFLLVREVGFRPVGVMRRYERGPDGQFHDGLLMDLLREELLPVRDQG